MSPARSTVLYGPAAAALRGLRKGQPRSATTTTRRASSPPTTTASRPSTPPSPRDPATIAAYLPPPPPCANTQADAAVAETSSADEWYMPPTAPCEGEPWPQDDDISAATVLFAEEEDASPSSVKPAMAPTPASAASPALATPEPSEATPTSSPTTTDDSFTGRELWKRLCEDEAAAVKLFRHLNTQKKLTNDHDLKNKLRPQLWLINDIIHGVNTKMPAEDIEGYLAGVRIPEGLMDDDEDEELAMERAMSPDALLDHLLHKEAIASWADEPDEADVCDTSLPCQCSVCMDLLPKC